jgi:hypothetical protein
MQSPETRATQRLLVQGFILYPCAAAVSTRLVARSLLDDPNHAWAVLCDSRSLDWTAMLADDDPLKAQLAEAAVRSTSGAPHALCHTQGGLLLVPLGPDTLNARMRIETAVALGKAPPAERLEAFPDELIEREAKRRAKRKERDESPPGVSPRD